MAFWADKYRPTSLDKVDYHEDVSKRLKRLIGTGDFPHLLVYGPSGAGKRTRIDCVLQELYGNGASKLRIDKINVEAPSGKKLEISMMCSNYHVVITPSDLGIYDRVVVQEVIKKMAQTQQLEINTQKRFKVIVLMSVDQLTRDAQHALRRTMEKYSSVCRLVLCCKSCSKVIPPIQSRCLPIRVAAPDERSVRRVLQKIAEKEQQPLTEPVESKLVAAAAGNLRRALLSFEAFCVHRNAKSPDKMAVEPDWMLYIKETAALILSEQSPKALLEVRERLYNLLSNCIPGTLIIKTLSLQLLSSCDARVKHDVVALAADYEYSLNKGSKSIFHLEAFVAEFMSAHKRLQVK